MLITLKEALKYAENRQCAVGAFNTPNLECILAVLHAAKDSNVPVIISHAQLHEDVSPLDEIGPVMVEEAKRAKTPVCVHLDHCEDLAYMKRALELGFTGVMYDGSTLPFQTNVQNTRVAVSMAKEYGAGVEAEIGTLSARENGEAAVGPVYTEPDAAVAFVEATGIDALAPSFGTSHGIYKAKPVLDLARVGKIRSLVGLPLVMHGGSGVSPADYAEAIRLGIRKINYYSYMSREGVRAARQMLMQRDVTFFHELAFAAQQAMQDDAQKAMKVFYRV